MLTAIKDIGKNLLDGSDEKFLEEITINMPVNKAGESANKAKQYAVVVNFDTKESRVSFEPRVLSKNLPKKYLWIGNAPSSSFQWLATTNNLNYICSQTLPSLYNKLDENSELRKRIEKVIENCYTGFSEKIGKKYRYVWDLSKLKIKEDFSPEKFEKSIKVKNKKLVEQIAKIIEDHIREELYFDTNDEIVLYTIKIDGDYICDNKDYRKLIYDDKVGGIFKESKKRVCSVCGNIGNTTFETKRLDFKYYNTNKISFSSGVGGNFGKNHVLCEECYKGSIVGETFIKPYLGTRIGSFDLYIIPNFLFGTQIGNEQMYKLSRHIVYSFNSVVSYKGLENFINDLDALKELENIKENYVLNILFHDSGGATQQFKILRLIKDVAPTRMEEMRKTTSKVRGIGNNLFGDSRLWAIELDKIFHLIPLRKTKDRKGKITIYEISKLMEIYDAIFSKNPISKEFLINKFVELASIYRLKRFNIYNTSTPRGSSSDTAYDSALVRAMLQANLCMLYMKILGVLQGGKIMNVNDLYLNDDVKQYIKEIGYGEQETAMFLLGYLIADIASAQFRENLKRKPILDKIPYQGMNKNKIIMITTEIFEKLRQYKVLEHNETIFSQFKMFLDSNINKWELNDKENVFYILSGYSYRTYKILTGKQKKEDESDD